ncbi:hypothetical protein CYMTET_38013 [Cymbomonas tetramitiformis]|uniref:Uncharacterized protein n=1 Tax=Cymbomonas tetramitiformis TaxID=36881 RepID=A0AAE0CEY7_9CHLO|nr:hypothetical protein CYMTET_38013 [Cymbomonas tetramitiformis]
MVPYLTRRMTSPRAPCLPHLRQDLVAEPKPQQAMASWLLLSALFGDGQPREDDVHSKLLFHSLSLLDGIRSERGAVLDSEVDDTDEMERDIREMYFISGGQHTMP